MAWILHVHGAAAVVALFVGHRMRKALLSGTSGTRQPHVLAWASALLACVAFLFVSGAVLYARYRAPGGVRTWLLSNAPTWHSTWFEWKEHLGFFALVLCGGLWLSALRPLRPGGRALAMPVLLALLISLVVAATVGCLLSFAVRSVA